MRRPVCPVVAEVPEVSGNLVKEKKDEETDHLLWRLQYMGI